MDFQREESQSGEGGRRSQAMPRVSIVLTTYNRAEALSKTLDTLLVQSLIDFELIVCDDCSTDRTPEVVTEYAARDPRIIYQRNQRNLRMPGNLNVKA